ncbi:TldD/PmbA family protein [Paracoccaceae bacterium GXU_MW_L88]
MSHDLSHLAHHLLDLAQKAGADAADVLAAEGVSQSIEVRAGQLDQIERAEGIDLGLRVLVGTRQACVSASDPREATLATLAERAVTMARLAPEDPTAGLADPSELATDTDMSALDLVDDSPAPSPDELLDRARAAEAAALAHKGISQVEMAGAYASDSRVHMAMSNGFSAGYRRTGHAQHCVAVAGTGTRMERDSHGDSRSHLSDLESAAHIGDLAATRALARIGAQKPPTGTYPVLYDERIAGGLIGHLLAAINGMSIARGDSWLKDAMGERVLPEGLDLTCAPHRPRTTSARLFDAEGLPTRALPLVADGVLQSWVLDLSTARKLGLESTGHAARGTSSPPRPAVGNLTMTQGTASREDLIRDMGTGLIVTGLIGSTINSSTGDYSRGINGFWVENGEITGPVQECTIAGNLRDMLARVIPANDARTHLSRVVPSLLVEGMTVAGN